MERAHASRGGAGGRLCLERKNVSEPLERRLRHHRSGTDRISLACVTRLRSRCANEYSDLQVGSLRHLYPGLDGSTQRTAAATCYSNLHSDRPSVRASWRARHGRSSGDQTAELKNSKSAKCRALRQKLESPSSLYARRHSRDSGIATTRPPIGDSIMTVLLKYLAVLGFAGALSLATTTAFAQNVSGSVCGENSNGVYYC
jgi:hypothetical protein